jgi:hypothetical protein
MGVHLICGHLMVIHLIGVYLRGVLLEMSAIHSPILLQSTETES